MEFKRKDLEKVRQYFNDLQNKRSQYVRRSDSETRCSNCKHYELRSWKPESEDLYSDIQSQCDNAILLGLVVTFLPDDCCESNFEPL